MKARRKWLIIPHFQLRFVAFCALTAVSACAFFYLAVLAFFQKYIGWANEVGFKPDHPFYVVLSNMQDLMMWMFFITSGATIMFSLAAGLWFSNKVAGPILRLKNHIESVARGETTGDVSFRKGDFFRDLAAAYNEQMKRLRGQTSASSGDDA